MVRALLLLPLALLVGCRTSTKARPPPVAQWEAPLTLVNGLPAVNATVAGKQVLFLVDTQATVTTVEAWASASDVQVQLGAQVTNAKTTATVPGHEALHIGGTLSPQALLESGAVVLDFPAQKLFALGGSENTWLRWLDERSPKGQLAGVTRASPLERGLHVKTRVGDAREVVAQVATQQPRTGYLRSLFDASLVQGDHVSGLFLKIHEAEYGPLDVAVLDALPDAEGRLGFDFLGSMVLLLPVQPGAPIWFMTPRE